MLSRRRGTNLTAAFLLVAVAAMIGLVAGCAAAATSHKREQSDLLSGATGGSTASVVSNTATPPAPADGSIVTLSGRPVPIVFRPPGLSPAHQVPLVIALYGADGCPRCMQSLTGFNQVANQHGFVVAYPGAVTNPPWRSPSDIAYLRSFIQNITKWQNIDPKRVYVAGFSAGGREIYTVGCSLSRYVAGVASVSGVMRSFRCPLTHPVSEVTIVGSTETTAVKGSKSGVLSASATASAWRARNGCPPQAQAQVNAVGAVAEQTWNRCVDGSGVALYVVRGGGHLWPGMGGLAPSNPDAGFSASQAIWSFFAAHPAGSLTKPDATFRSLVSRPNRRLTATFGLGEPVTVHVTLVGSRTLASKNVSLLTGSSRNLTLTVPRNVRRGGYKVKLQIRDAYGRTTSLVRQIRLNY
jgi:polyhydroxybutyrate depolymerase